MYPFLPDAWALRLEHVSVTGEAAVIVAASARPTGTCPQCDQPAARVHSRYTRTLQDLSWQGTRVTIHWRSRKFFCDTAGCPQRIFTEQLPQVTCRHGRRTSRARDVLECLGLALGGEAGCRVAHQLQLQVSADTLLRTVRRTVPRPFVEPRVIGVDDWALRRGQRYGTLIVDLERHRPLDLLPDRKWETLRDWLDQHPSVEILSRDRADCYARGAARGAPAAIQVADRWHLLKNLREALRHSAERFAADIQRAVHEVAAFTPRTEPESTSAAVNPPVSSDPQPKIADSPAEMRRARRRERYQQVKNLRAQGKSQREIAHTMGLNRKTVRRYLRAEAFPERAASPRVGSTTPFLNDLQRLWNEGCHNARTLTKQLQQLGYRGTYHSVRRKVASWRRIARAEKQGAGARRQRTRAAVNIPSAERVAWLLFLEPQELDAADQALARAIHDTCPPLGVASELAHDFTNLFKRRCVDDLEAWIQRASADHVPVDVRHFAQGLRTDLPAIEAAVALPWSNGQTEGQINRLKLMKREMYGRANLDLLKLRFLLNSASRGQNLAA